jgi:hypothetical protein
MYVHNNPTNFVDPSGEVTFAAIGVGALVGGTFSGVSAYLSGVRGEELIRVTSIGAVAGAFSAGSGAWAASAVSIAANIATQLATGTPIKNLDFTSAVISGAAGGLGVGIGSNLRSNFMPSVIGRSYQELQFTEELIDEALSGGIAGFLDLVGNRIRNNFNKVSEDK